jgi:predicted nucleic acid-binding protein
VYFDTSALVKLIFDEPGSEDAVELWDRADVALSGQLVYPEGRAALAAAARAGRTDDAIGRLAVDELYELYGQLQIVGVDEPIARHAGELAERHALRGYDAVHLACALAVQADDVLLATWDNALGQAARETGRLLVNRTA